MSTHAHAEGAAKIIENNPRARVASVIHGFVWNRIDFKVRDEGDEGV